MTSFARRLAPLGRILLLLSIAIPAAGCKSYKLQGKVIAGDISYVAVVDADDPRLQEVGIAGAELRLETDPSRLSRDVVGETVSGPDGAFTMPFNKVGGGVLMYDVGLTARRPGYSPAVHQFKLPPPSRRLLIMLAPGPDRLGESDDDLMQQYERYR
jgi:hypothetical protein